MRCYEPEQQVIAEYLNLPEKKISISGTQGKHNEHNEYDAEDLWEPRTASLTIE